MSTVRLRNVRSGPVAGVAAQLWVLAATAAGVGLGVAGWLTGIAYAVATAAALTTGLNRAGADQLGPADKITLTRAVLVGAVTALTADSLTGASAPMPVVLIVVTAFALVLDAVDGQVARRTGTASTLGGRFDMEVDAFLILVLSVYVGASMGGWVITIGAMRYANGAAIWALPWLRGPVPPRYWRKVVAAIQGITLLVVAAQVLPAPINLAGVIVALTLLVESFGRDVVYLWWRRPAHRPILSGVRASWSASAAHADLSSVAGRRWVHPVDAPPRTHQ